MRRGPNLQRLALGAFRRRPVRQTKYSYRQESSQYESAIGDTEDSVPIGPYPIVPRYDRRFQPRSFHALNLCRELRSARDQTKGDQCIFDCGGCLLNLVPSNQRRCLVMSNAVSELP